MWRSALAGAVALVTANCLSVSDRGITLNTAAAQDIILHESDIARLKEALKLTPEQEVHWHPVEASLNAYARHQYRLASADSSFGARGMMEYALTSIMLQRIKATAQPLIRMLSEEQKRAGMSVLQSMGVYF
jgi:hypothetical protein